jgi:cyclophilin family peptidyl-prolyl cis-trans isomerase
MKTAIKFVAHASLMLASLVLLPSCGGGEDPVDFVVPADTDAGAAQRPQVTFIISNGAGVSGSMVVTLLPEYAPATVANFLAYVNSGFYSNTIIHRHDVNFVLQGGGYVSPVTALDSNPLHKATNAPIALELKVSNVRGTVAMARSDPLNSATSEFFINLADNTSLNTNFGGYAAFGYVTDFTLINAMTQAPCVTALITGGSGQTSVGCLPVPNLVITSAAQTR